MEYVYEPKGVCSQKMIIEIDEQSNTIRKVTIDKGCAGNSAGVSKLVEGLLVEEVIQKLKGIPCGFKGTSCPDQLARALEEYKTEKNKGK